MCVVTSRGDNEEVVCVEGQETQEISAYMRVCVWQGVWAGSRPEDRPKTGGKFQRSIPSGPSASCLTQRFPTLPSSETRPLPSLTDTGPQGFVLAAPSARMSPLSEQSPVSFKKLLLAHPHISL